MKTERTTPRRWHYFAGGTAFLSCVLALVEHPIFSFFACAFTWQATTYWCFYRKQITGRDVWETRQ